MNGVRGSAQCARRAAGQESATTTSPGVVQHRSRRGGSWERRGLDVQVRPGPPSSPSDCPGLDACYRSSQRFSKWARGVDGWPMFNHIARLACNEMGSSSFLPFSSSRSLAAQLAAASRPSLKYSACVATDCDVSGGPTRTKPGQASSGTHIGCCVATFTLGLETS